MRTAGIAIACLVLKLAAGYALFAYLSAVGSSEPRITLFVVAVLAVAIAILVSIVRRRKRAAEQPASCPPA